MNLGKETETLEFKKSTGELQEAMISISAILNKHGVGTLYFGIKPNGDVIGQDVSEGSMRDVSRKIYETIKPQIYPVINEEILDSKHVIKVEFNGDNKPYSASGRYYLRTADEDREVTPIELKNFFVANEYKEKWENAQSDSSISQVDRKTIKEFCDRAIDAGRLEEGKYTVPVILKKLGLTKDNFLNNAGETLFENKRFVTLKAAVFATNEKLTFLDIQQYEDNILNLLKISETYILKNIRWKGEIVGSEREEIPEVPVAVIREVLANSFAHAVYNSHTYHEICIYPGKITVYSPGTFASTYKPEDYIKKNVPSSIRNERISKILYLNKSIEKFGSGFKRIDSLCKDAGIKYSYESTNDGFTFILYRNEIGKIQKENVTLNDSINVTLNDTEKSVYKLLAQHPDYNRNQLAEATSKTVRTMQRTLDSLVKKGLIERVASRKTGYWRIIGDGVTKSV